MNDCCKNCKRNLNLTKFDYTKNGCQHTKMEGFICTAFANEGEAVWMIGLNQERDLCEEFLPKGDLDVENNF